MNQFHRLLLRRFHMFSNICNSSLNHNSCGSSKYSIASSFVFEASRGTRRLSLYHVNTMSGVPDCSSKKRRRKRRRGSKKKPRLDFLTVKKEMLTESSSSDIEVLFDSKESRVKEAERHLVTVDSEEEKMGNVESEYVAAVSQFSANAALVPVMSACPRFDQRHDFISAQPHCYQASRDFSSRESSRPRRKWQSTKKEAEFLNGKHSSKMQVMFTVMSYNVLAQDLLENHGYLYRNNDPQYLDWKYRSQLLMNEIKEAKADILCLQEVQYSHLESFYKELLEMGYMGIYKKRTGDNVDGVAVYYKTDKFMLADHTTVEYFQPGVNVLNRHNVGVIAKLSLRENPHNHIVVATTHLLFNPRRHDVKLAQIQLLLAEVERFAFQSFSYGKACYWPVFITGDMNFEPLTSVFRLLTTGMLRFEGLSSNFLESMQYGQTMSNTLLPRRMYILDTCQHWGIMCRRLIDDLNHTAELKVLKIHNTDHQRLMKELNMVSQMPNSFEEFMESAKEVGFANNFVQNFGPSPIPPMPQGGYGSGQLTHNLNLCSVYEFKNERDAAQQVTTFQDNGWVTVDYIFYSGHESRNKDVKTEGSLHLLSYYRLFGESEAMMLGAIPNKYAPSDHYPLVAKFCLEL